MRWALLWLLLVGMILLPFFLFEDQFTALALSIASGRLTTMAAAAAIGALLAADVILPVPSSVVSAGAGALLGFWKGAAVCWAGMTAGCIIGYLVGSRGARGVAVKLVGQPELERVQSIARRYGDWTLVLARAVPVLAEASVIFAGITRLAFRRFLFVTALSNLGIAIVYAAVGAYSVRIDSFLAAFFGAILLPAGAGLLLRRFERSS